MKSPTKLLKATATAFGLARKATDAEVIEAAIAEARTAIAEGERDGAEAQARYDESLLADDGDPALMLNAIQAAKIKRDRGEAQVATLTVRLNDVREASEQERRGAIYRDAEAKAEAARVALVQEYPAIARQMHGLLRLLAEAEIRVAQANADLPHGAAPIASPEWQVRYPGANLPPLPAPTMVKLWAPMGGSEPVPEEDQQRVRPMPGRAEWVGALRRDDGSTLECHRRTFRKSLEYEKPHGDWGTNLAGSVCLPALYPFTPPVWPQNLINGKTFDRSADVALSTLDDVEPLSAAVWRRAEAILKVVTRFREEGRPLNVVDDGAPRVPRHQPVTDLALRHQPVTDLALYDEDDGEAEGEAA
jgi:hypothetical protein